MGYEQMVTEVKERLHLFQSKAIPYVSWWVDMDYLLMTLRVKDEEIAKLQAENKAIKERLCRLQS